MSTSYGVLSSRQLSLTFLIPETSSRVTLAALGIGFQPKLPTTKHQQPIIIYFYLLIFYSQQSDHKFWLEANTERSESNPGRSLGLYKARRDGCLEDSTQLICSFTFGSVRTRSKSSRITLMRRILSFHRFYFFLCCQLILDLLRIVFAPIRRWITSSKR